MVMIAKYVDDSEPGIEDFLALFPGHHVFYWDNHKKDKTAHAQMGSDKPSIVDTLKDRNKCGYSIYMTMSEIVKGDKRTKADFVRACAIGLDDDEGKCDPLLFPIQPNIVVNTSPGKRQFFWLTTTNDREELEAVNRCLSTNYHGDSSFGDCTRVCRLPGFKNHKYDIAPEVTFEINSTVPYAWEDIKSNFPPEYEVAKHPKGGRAVNGRVALDIGKTITSVIEGDEVYPSCLRLSASLITQGMNPKAVYSILSGVLNTSKAEKSRIEKARGKLWDLIDSATENFVTKLNNKRKDNEFGSMDTKLKWPPGKLGEVAKHINKTMPKPSPEIAIASAFSLISTIGGGCYHYQGATVARRRVVLAPNGRGKSTLVDYSRLAFRQIPLEEDLNDMFFTSPAFTAQNNHLDLMANRIRMMVINEAGIASGSTAGDPGSRDAYLLNSLSVKAYGDVTITQKARTKNNDPTKPVQGGTFVIVEESTPETYMEGFHASKAMDSGNAARTETFFIGIEDYYNEDFFQHMTIPEDLLKLYTSLVQQYITADVSDGTLNDNLLQRLINIDFSEVEAEFRDMAHENIVQLKKAGTDNSLRSPIVRSREKYLGTCMVLAIADSCDVNSLTPKRPKVTKEHLQYSIEYHAELDRAFSANLQGGVFASSIDRVMSDLETALMTAGTDEDFARDKLDGGYITSAWVTRRLRGKNSFKTLIKEPFCKHQKPKAVAMIILENACEEHMLQASAKSHLYINLMKG